MDVFNLLKGKCTGGLTYGSMNQWREGRKLMNEMRDVQLNECCDV
jgi:hypothetical protein